VLALSLTTLQAEATRLLQARRPLSNELAHLGGLNRIQGYTTEPDGELILLGARDASLPVLHLDDLAVALRNAYQVSSTYAGAPGCTIDPWPGGQDPWQIQAVQVFGMPASTAMAARHVALDYELKRVSAGIVSLGDRVPSLYDLSRSTEPPCAGPPPQEQRTEVAHRFWFYPRYPEPPRFLVEGATVLVLKPVEAMLLTEREFLDKTGQRTGAAPPAPQAEHFARLITELLATNPPRPYAHLCSDFRVIEVGKLVHFRQVPATSLRYLLQEHPLTAVAVPRFVGGVRREEQGEVVCASEITERQGPKGTVVQAQAQVRRSHRTSRGGVEVKITLTTPQLVAERAGALDPLRRRVRASRPSPQALVWSLAA
jgi:hypothetical protein